MHPLHCPIYFILVVLEQVGDTTIISFVLQKFELAWTHLILEIHEYPHEGCTSKRKNRKTPTVMIQDSLSLDSRRAYRNKLNWYRSVHGFTMCICNSNATTTVTFGDIIMGASFFYKHYIQKSFTIQAEQDLIKDIPWIQIFFQMNFDLGNK
ncbi:hypothetical protein NE237_012165 [Protea cynaroides]|uniref:Uncharacterized protein n=1 Tax=Protea cynaroides TaxID=273540 RepID=A0A9Q0JXR5_9MAGN|nr:hypothetical protein NE237_012165 [Protea cynaroides]